MDLNIGREVARMQTLTVRQLRLPCAEVLGESTTANNTAWMLRRIAWRLQALGGGDLSERARRRADELAERHAVLEERAGLACCNADAIRELLTEDAVLRLEVLDHARQFPVGRQLWRRIKGAERAGVGNRPRR